MKNKVLISAVIILAILSVGTLAGIMLSRQSMPLVVEASEVSNEESKNVLVASGSGKISLSPDIAFINAGVETILKDAGDAQQENARIMNRIISALKAVGIDEKDIQTVNYSVNIEYDFSDNERRLIGYRVSNTVRVTIRDIDRVGEVLTEIADAGANHFFGISFGIENQDKAYKDALKLAIDEAKAKAKVMAEQAGVTLAEPLSINEGYAVQPFQFGQGMDMMREAAAVQVPVMEGQLEVHATVTIAFRIK